MNPPTPRKSPWPLYAILVASLGTNIYLYGELDQATETSRHTTVGSETQTHHSSEQVDVKPAKIKPEDSTTKLKPAPPGSGTTSNTPTNIATTKVTPQMDNQHKGKAPAKWPGLDKELQEGVLNHFAREHMRKTWLDNREKNERWFRSFINPEAQKKWSMRQVQRHSDFLQLSENERAAYTERYLEMIQPGWEKVVEALRAEPIDYASIIKYQRGLNRAENKLILELKGAGVLEGFRASEIERRMRTMAMFSTYSDLSWDSIEW